jgi:hypothetical protein
VSLDPEKMRHNCAFSNCTRPAIVTMVGCEYCVAHFILASYKHLEKSSERVVDAGIEGNPQQDTLLEIAATVTSLTLNGIALTNHERGQLTDILLWACDLLSERRPKAS